MLTALRPCKCRGAELLFVGEALRLFKDRLGEVQRLIAAVVDIGVVASEAAAGEFQSGIAADTLPQDGGAIILERIIAVKIVRHHYYKLRDLGTALGFTVDWSAEQGVFIQTT